MNNTSTVGVSFKVDKALRDNFKAACEKDGYSSSLVHRKLMEQYVSAKQNSPVDDFIRESLVNLSDMKKNRANSMSLDELGRFLNIQ